MKEYNKEQLEILNEIYLDSLKVREITFDFRIKIAKKMLKYNFKDKDILKVCEINKEQLDKIK